MHVQTWNVAIHIYLAFHQALLCCIIVTIIEKKGSKHLPRAEMAKLFPGMIALTGMQSFQQPSTTHLLHMFYPAFSDKLKEGRKTHLVRATEEKTENKFLLQ